MKKLEKKIASYQHLTSKQENITPSSKNNAAKKELLKKEIFKTWTSNYRRLKSMNHQLIHVVLRQNLRTFILN